MAKTDQLTEWRSVWLKAVALSWKDPAFKQELLADARRALEVYFDYTLPTSVDLKVVEPASPDTMGWRQRGGQHAWSLPLPKLEMALPPKPKDDNLQAVALASYDPHHPMGCF